MPLQPGSLLHERYLIKRQLGKGGMGAVYLAHDQTLDIRVAIKENLNPNPESERQFRRETKLLAELRHPNLPRVTDYFILEGRQYLAMDFIKGEDLHKRSQQQPPTVNEVLAWADAMCSALIYLHSRPQPVIHRDIKPPNIKLQPDGTVVLVDFGLAKEFDQAVTATGARGLTPGYSPPEQYGAQSTDARSDQYSLAATVYSLLTGKRPADSIDRKLENEVLVSSHTLNPLIPKHVDAAIRRALELDPKDRFPDVESFRAALRGLLKVETIRPEHIPQVRPRRSLKGLFIGVGAVGILLTLVVVALGLGGILPSTQPDPTPLSTEPLLAAVEASSTPIPTNTPLPPTETPVPPTPTVHHLTRPGDPPVRLLFLTDSASANSADERRATGGDDYMRNRYERPFTSIEMDYRPDLDITRSEIAFDPEWIYFSIELEGADPNTGRFTGAYAVELDLDVDGDGDWLITSSMPGDGAWSTDGVRAWYDANDNVGGETPMGADPPPQDGDGFEVLSFDQGQGEDPDAAWSRLTPSGSERVQIAIKRSLIGGDSAFLWGIWAANVEIFMEVFDLNDSYTLAEAGSPMANSDNYPVKAVALVDNTCRMYYGFTPTGNEPGLCLIFGTIQNCIFHDVLIKPGDVIIEGRMNNPNPILNNIMPGTYSFYDTDVGGPDPVLTATLLPGGLIQITTDGFGTTYDCP